MIDMAEYAKRRKRLMDEVGESGIMILPSASQVIRNGDADYAFRQNSDFYYLTGFDEPEAVLVLVPGRVEGEFLLFIRRHDPQFEIWDGPRAGLEGAQQDFLADQAFAIEEFNLSLADLLSGRSEIHYPLGINHEFDQLILTMVRKLHTKIRTGLVGPLKFIDIIPTIHEMRLIKSPAEVSIIQRAVDITRMAHIQAMRVCKPGIYEYELEAELTYIFQKHGARSCAYNSIVGSGPNTCILHYVQNNRQIQNDDLVLIDAGAEYHNYASDITRTFPANGRFSAEQQAIYELVLAAQLAAIAVLKPGLSWDAPQAVIIQTITQGLIDLGILRGNVADLIEQKAYFPFYMHRSGHWLGLDVHDVGRYQIQNQWREMQAGMMFTVEPGIYIGANNTAVDQRWHNIGVRIEDNVLITNNGVTVLSQAIPKTVQAITEVMAGQR